MNKGVKILITIAAVILMWAMVIGVVLFLDEKRSTCKDGPPPSRTEKAFNLFYLKIICISVFKAYGFHIRLVSEICAFTCPMMICIIIQRRIVKSLCHVKRIYTRMYRSCQHGSLAFWN